MSLRASSLAGGRRLEPPLESPARAEVTSDPPARRATARSTAPRANRLNAWVSGTIAIAVTATLLVGFAYRDATGLTPGKGLGYWLGIVGGLTILAVLGYPMRKYVRSWRSFGTTSGWFTAHMLLGTLGPAIILFHAGFQLGAFNSNVALITMLFVAGSGVVGRYLYGQLQKVLQGRRAELSQMLSHTADMRLALGGDLPEGSPVWQELTQLEEMARTPARGLFGALRQSLGLSFRANGVRRLVARDTRRFIDAESRRFGLKSKQRKAWQRAAREHLEAYFAAVLAAARLILFERMFSAWHYLHVPLFVVMTLSVVVHIVAVHFY